MVPAGIAREKNIGSLLGLVGCVALPMGELYA